MANTLKFGGGQWATKEGSTLAYNDENGNFKPLPFTFDRAGSATRVNKQGLIEVVPNNEPRIDFLNDSKGALLLEPSRSNLIEQSNNFSAWSVISNVTLDADSSISPDGENTATKIIPNSSNAIHQIRLIYSSATNTYNFSVFAKKGEYKNILIWDDTVAEGIGVNLDDLSIFRNENVEGYKIEQHSNGWVRISYTRSYTSEQPRPSIYVYDNSATPQITFSGNGSDGLYLWGAQFEIGSYATSLIPTQGSIGTRVAESCNNGANEQVINSTEGVLYVETKGFIDVPPTSKYIQLSKNGEASFNNSLVLQHRNNGYLRIYANGTATANIHFNENIDFSENHKIAVLYKLNGYKLFIDGVEKNLFGTPLQTVFSGLDDFSFDNRGDNGWNGKIKEVKLYNEILTDQELINLTTI